MFQLQIHLLVLFGHCITRQASIAIHENNETCFKCWIVSFQNLLSHTNCNPQTTVFTNGSQMSFAMCWYLQVLKANEKSSKVSCTVRFLKACTGSVIASCHSAFVNTDVLPQNVGIKIVSRILNMVMCTR